MLDSSTETDTERKLSDYMLEGIKQTDRLEKLYIKAGPVRFKTCALGAACFIKEHEQIVELRTDFGMAEAYEAFPELNDSIPETDLDLRVYRPSDLGELVMVLNDKWHWRRDRIARYLKKLGY